MKLCGVLLCSALLAGCGEQGRESAAVLMDAPQASRPVEITMFIATSIRGGNSHWTNDYIQRVLGQATLETGGALHFSLALLGYLGESHYAMNQYELYHEVMDYGMTGEVVVVVSNEMTTDSAGITTQGFQRTPVLVMRARDPENISEVAQIFLHELGHCFGLAHYAIDPGGPVADDWYRRADGLALFHQYRQRVGL